MTEILHKELSFAIVGCIFDVHNGVGPGVREECYQKALEQRLSERGLPFVAKPATRRELIYRERVVDVFVPDLIVADRIIPELKHQVEGFVAENVSQVLNYLKFWNLDLGLLANFALDHAVIEREGNKGQAYYLTTSSPAGRIGAGWGGGLAGLKGSDDDDGSEDDCGFGGDSVLSLHFAVRAAGVFVW